MTAPRILMVDDDPAFCQLLVGVAAQTGIEVDTVGSVADAKSQLADPRYTAFTLDGDLPDGLGIELAAHIRDSGDQRPISFISFRYDDASNFRRMKDEIGVNFVLHKPVSVPVLQSLLQQLCPNAGGTASDDEDDDMLAELREVYNLGIADKVENLETQIEAIRQAADAEGIRAFARAVHKIAGSAGSYGYDDVSSLCREMEKSALALDPDAVPEGWLEELPRFLRRLKLAFQLLPMDA